MSRPRRPKPLARPLRPVPGEPDDRPRRHDRERRAAVDPRRPRLLRDVARVGRERVPAHVRRVPAARRAARRPLRAPAAVPDRDQRSSRWRRSPAGSRPRRAFLDRRARRAGRRRRDRLGGLALADDQRCSPSRPSARRRWASSASSPPAAAASASLLGGILTDALSWHWIFLVNFPIGVARRRCSRCGCCRRSMSGWPTSGSTSPAR